MNARDRAAPHHAMGYLDARPGPAGGSPGPAGPARGGREPLIHTPPGYRPDRPAPLVLFFHGAGGSAAQMLSLFAPFADTHGFIVAAPSSGGQTWDVILSDYGPDVAAVDRLLAEVFARHPVDPRRVAAAGFSDGASYALSLGLANGNLFSHVIAFSPGFMVPRRAEGTPFVFVSHGAEDPVLPIARCSRRIVPALQNAGYPVRYVEFPDGHAVPPEVCDEACLWFRETG